MAQIIIPALEIVDHAFTEYELPPEGISTLGYVVRRMHKTHLLIEVDTLIQRHLYPYALAQVGHYAVASSATFGQMPYEPRPTQIGASITEYDPATNAFVMATKANISTANCYSFIVKLPDGAMLIGHKLEQESHFQPRGISTPTTINLTFTSADEQYQAQLHGILNHERLPRIVGTPLCRAYGELKFQDNQEHHGVLTLKRNAEATVQISNSYGRLILKRTFHL